MLDLVGIPDDRFCRDVVTQLVCRNFVVVAVLDKPLSPTYEVTPTMTELWYSIGLILSYWCTFITILGANAEEKKII